MTPGMSTAAQGGQKNAGETEGFRKIQLLEKDQKIYDFYYWEEVLQEDGDGGKVVVCRQKGAETQDFDYVLKIRSKASIQKQPGDMERFRQMLLKVLNIPSHIGVMKYLEVYEND